MVASFVLVSCLSSLLRGPLVARSRLLMTAVSPSVGTLYDVPVSNNGARCRMVLSWLKVSASEVAVVSPALLGGLKSEAYLEANPQGKMPLLTTPAGEAIPESDTICRFLCATFAGRGPQLIPTDPLEAARSDRICRLHDVYLGAVQSAMYKVAGSGGPQTFPPFGPFGSREAALGELVSQLRVLESYMDEHGPYIVGKTPTLADCTIWPSAIFWARILPKFEIVDSGSLFGPRLTRWMAHMAVDEVGAKILADISSGLDEWEAKDRWALILGAGTRDGADATLFDKILEGKIPATVVYEDALCLAFRDISPVAPTHVILIPKRRDGLTQLQFATAEHKQVLGHMLAVAVPAIAAKEGLNSYRLVVNDGAEACQSVFHLHMHIIGGKKLSWPPGA
mmetsp:Transcript_31276/g.71888  ORF Transcript_31276/g.71888 Transcript_31276/m.71888 type:complete len:395 (-) Transcript_31276:172-1356(-)